MYWVYFLNTNTKAIHDLPHAFIKKKKQKHLSSTFLPKKPDDLKTP